MLISHFLAQHMHRGSTFVLRSAVVFLGIVVLALCIFALPAMWKGGSEEYPVASQAFFLIMMGMYVTAVPFYVALWQTLKLLGLIDQNKAFSEMSVKALKSIKICAIIISVLYIGGIPLLLPIAEADDAPGLMVMGLIVVCAPVVVAVFAAVLEKLLRQAITLQSENELTV